MERLTLPSPLPDPFEALYHYDRSESGTAFFAELERCVNRVGWSYGRSGWHIWTATLREYVQGTCTTYAGSLLERFNNRWQPEDAAALLLIDGRPAPGLVGVAPEGFVTPWAAPREGVKAAIRFRARLGMRENRGLGRPDLGSEVTWGGIFPVSHAKGRLEFERLTRLWESVHQMGYVRRAGRDGDILGRVLRRGDDHRVFVSGSGQRRTAVLSILGWERVPVRLRHPAVVDRRDVDCWPQVRRGVWDRASALRYFNHLFDSKGHDVASELGVVRCTG